MPDERVMKPRMKLLDRMRTNLSAEPPKCRESIVFDDTEVKLIYLEDEADDEVS